MKYFTKPVWLLTGALIFFCVAEIHAQVSSGTPVDLTAFKQPANGWQTAGDVSVQWTKPQILSAMPGDGVLVHIPKRKAKADDLVTVAQYGDIVLELDYLLASGTNATISLHDAYEIVLADTKGEWRTTAQSNGGTPGYAPRQQVGRAPGLWQHLKLTFKAPQFDHVGDKTAPARLLLAELNGVTIHENIQLQATPGAVERPEAPIRITPIQGAIAFRNIQVNDWVENPEPQNETRRGNFTPPDPILVHAQANTILRSFMDIPERTRVVHAASVGHTQQVHYTYDLDHGNIVQVWKGGFLDATPMWHNRGNGTSRILGSPVYFGKPRLSLAKLASAAAAWPQDTVETGFKPKGYTLDSEDLPTFNYQLYGALVSDATKPLPAGNGLTRTINVSNAPEGLYLQLAKAADIEDQGNGVYVIGDKSWFLKLEESGKDKPILRDQPDGKELLIPIRTSVSYSIIF